MVGVLDTATDPRAATREAFARALDGFAPDRPALVVSHFDADGLSAAAVLARGLGRPAEVRITGKGESPWDSDFRAELEARSPGGLILADLGTRAEPVLPSVPTVVIDHHVPTGAPEDATTISGNGLEPEPTSALLAYWAVGAPEDLAWLPALGLIGDMADDGWPELTAAQERYGKTALKDATSLINAPRRTAAADASPALALLMRGDGPKVVTKEPSPERDALLAAKAEVAAELEAAKRVPPRVVGDVALIRFHSPTQIHPLIAQQWRGRLKDKIVIAANSGYREGWVHFAARSATGRNLVEFLAEHRPDGADSRYGSGHAQATGGALRYPEWNAFVERIGFPEGRIAA
ncbi:DHH family phosphoesterase [Sphingomonas lenta]|uniref:Phosphoesterase n=1 Tax=Sphingomonas lenta TaxID=1141887 RepID=A0A2A2SBI5_9SPHN|nr:DHH family phosphoesterase [Sphingomonas lenta]PAX06664.1 phosphoesterase [Sphingomonas lenta]